MGCQNVNTNMSTFTKNLTQFYLTEKSGIIGRNNEIQQMFLTLLRHEKPNILLLGDPGVGKSSMVYLLAELIAKEACPKWLKGYSVIEVQTNALLAGPGYRGTTEEKFQNLIESCVGKKTILFFDEFHTVTHLGEMANGQTPGLGNTLKTYLTKNDFKVIGATTTEEIKKIDDKALLRRFTKINIGEPSDEALLNICQFIFDKYSRTALENRVDWTEVISLSKSLDGVNPDKLKNILDIAIAKAKLEENDSLTSLHIDYAVNMLSQNVPMVTTEEQF